MFQNILKVTPDGSDDSGITIKFTLTAEPLGREGDSADKRQATETIDKVTKALEQVHDTPAAIRVISPVVGAGAKIADDSDTAKNVVNTLQTFQNLSPVLPKWMGLFDKISGAVAEVFHFEFPRPHGLNSHRSTHIQRRLGPFYQQRTRSVCLWVPYYH